MEFCYLGLHSPDDFPGYGGLTWAVAAYPGQTAADFVKDCIVEISSCDCGQWKIEGFDAVSLASDLVSDPLSTEKFDAQSDELLSKNSDAELYHWIGLTNTMAEVA